jgi:hypothetical protein
MWEREEDFYAECNSLTCLLLLFRCLSLSFLTQLRAAVDLISLCTMPPGLSISFFLSQSTTRCQLKSELLHHVNPACINKSRRENKMQTEMNKKKNKTTLQQQFQKHDLLGD